MVEYYYLTANKENNIHILLLLLKFLSSLAEYSILRLFVSTTNFDVIKYKDKSLCNLDDLHIQRYKAYYE